MAAAAEPPRLALELPGDLAAKRQKVASSPREYACEYCDRKFGHPPALSVHRKACRSSSRNGPAAGSPRPRPPAGSPRQKPAVLARGGSKPSTAAGRAGSAVSESEEESVSESESEDGSESGSEEEDDDVSRGSAWTPREDSELCSMVKKDGTGNWQDKAASFASSRSASSIRHRWKMLEEALVTPAKGSASPRMLPKQQSKPLASGTRQYECDRCGRIFGHPPALAIHSKSCVLHVGKSLNQAVLKAKKSKSKGSKAKAKAAKNMSSPSPAGSSKTTPRPAAKKSPSVPAPGTAVSRSVGSNGQSPRSGGNSSPRGGSGSSPKGRFAGSCDSCGRKFGHPPALAIHRKSCGLSPGQKSPRRSSAQVWLPSAQPTITEPPWRRSHSQVVTAWPSGLVASPEADSEAD